MKKTLKIVLTALMLVVVLALFAGCEKGHEHFSVTGPAVEPTCTSAGLTEGEYCYLCGAVLVERQHIPMTEHVYDDENDLDCNDCGEARDASCEHVNTAVMPGAPTSCYATGLTEGEECLDCKDILEAQGIIPMIAHTFDNEQDVNCNVCEYERPVVCPHPWTEKLSGREATCTQTGLTEGEKCRICGEITVHQTEIPMKSHTYDNDADKECNSCGYKITEECNHRRTERIAGTRPTCLTDGLTDGERCRKCGAIVKAQEVIPALGHKYDNDDDMDCNVCGDVRGESNPPSVEGSQGLAYELLEDGTYAVVGIGTCTDTDIVIPSHHEGKLVTAIGNYAFYENSNITSVVISDSVKSIGESAFALCTGLKSATLGNGVTTLGNTAFAMCSSLEEIIIPSNVKSIGMQAFMNCEKLGYVELNEGLSSVDQMVFYGCASLKSIRIPDSVTNIGAGLFVNCIGLEEVIFPERFDETDNIDTTQMFYCCTSLKSMVLPEGIEELGGYMFGECTNLKSLTIPKTVTVSKYPFGGSSRVSLDAIYISDITAWCNMICEYGPDTTHMISNPLAFCDKLYVNGELLTDLVIPASVSYVRPFAFWHCKTITSVAFENGVVSIGERAFESCTNLSSVELSKSLGNIGEYAFAYCTNLSSVTIPNGLTHIGNSAFAGCTSLQSMTLPQTVTNIGEHAFSDCTSLSRIFMPNTINSIENYAFRGCTSLKSINIPSDISYIGNGAFDNCSLLEYSEYDNAIYFGNEENKYLYLVKAKDEYIESCNIHESTKFIGRGAFYGCYNLESIDIPSNVISIGTQAFSGTRLTTVTIPQSVTIIHESAFENCFDLTSVVLHDNIEYIGSHVFHNCESLNYNEYGNALYLGTEENPYLYLIYAKDTSITSVDIHKGTKIIAGAAFVSCADLQSVVIPDSVTVIGGYAFAYCDSLNSVVIGNGVKILKSETFRDCTNLTSLTLNSGINEIEDGVFNGIYGGVLRSIIFNGTVEEWNLVEQALANETYISTIICTDGEISLN